MGGSKRKARRSRVISDVNLTNLIDVVFALLIIFMITAPMMTQGVQVDLPKAEAENVEVDKSIQVTINSKNEIYIDYEKYLCWISKKASGGICRRRKYLYS